MTARTNRTDILRQLSREKQVTAGALGAFAACAVALAIVLHQSPAVAGCGCEKAPPDAASIRPNATWAGQEVTLIHPWLSGNTVYTVEFTAGAIDEPDSDELEIDAPEIVPVEPVIVTAVPVYRRDLADGVSKRQLVVELPDLPLGPTAVTVRTVTGAVVMRVDDAELTTISAPATISSKPGEQSFADYSAGVGRDGTVYVGLDLTGITHARTFRARALGYPLTMTIDDVAFYNSQGFLMQLIDSTMPGLSSVEATDSHKDSDVLVYARHEFNSYYMQHAERRLHAVDASDSNWHLDGTPHINHDHLILAIAGTIGNDKSPRPGATRPFDLIVQTATLFDEGLMAEYEVDVEDQSLADSYDARSGLYGSKATVRSNRKVDIENSAQLFGNAVGPWVDVDSSATVTGSRNESADTIHLMPAEIPDNLRELGRVDLNKNKSLVLRPGSYHAVEIKVRDKAVLNIDNAAGPVTIYVSGEVRFEDDSSLTAGDLDPEKLAIYVIGEKQIRIVDDAVVHAVFYAPESEFEVRGSARFYGAVVAYEIDIEDSAEFHYTESLKAGFDTPVAPVAGLCSDGYTYVNLDFDDLPTGQIVNHQYSQHGIAISADNHNGGPDLAVIFDSANPTGGDYDIGTPNQSFGGPGSGSGGAASGDGPNGIAQGKVLISQEHGYDRGDGIISTEPDDQTGGGSIVFDFDSATRVVSVEMLDVHSGGQIVARDAHGNAIATAPILSLGTNAFQVVGIEADGVRQLSVDFADTATVASLQLCVPN